MSSNLTLLKTFTEGEIIKAKDTNSNNAFLDNKIDKTKEELETKIGAVSSSLTPFSVNSCTYTNGERIFLSYEEITDNDGIVTTVLKAKAPFTFTTGNRQTIDVADNVYLDVGNLSADIEYNIFVDFDIETKTVSLVALNNKIYKSFAEPQELNKNDIWLNTQEPMSAYIKTLSGLELTNKTLVARFTNGKIDDVALLQAQVTDFTKYSVNSGAVDESGNPAYLVSYTEDVEIPATDETAEPTTETHTYLKLLAGTVYTDDNSTYTVAQDVVVEITDKNTADITYNVFVEHTGGEDVLTIKENLVEVANVGTTPTVAEETVEDNYLLIPQEPLQAYWVDSTATKTSTSAVNIGSYNGGGVTKPLLKDYSQDVLTDLRVKKEVRLVESYINSTSGYRIYSDGFCEQWGRFAGKTVTLLKPYINNTYSIAIAKITTRESSSSVVSILTSKVTNKSFYATSNYNDAVAGNPSGSWTTKGFIK